MIHIAQVQQLVDRTDWQGLRLEQDQMALRLNNLLIDAISDFKKNV